MIALPYKLLFIVSLGAGLFALGYLQGVGAGRVDQLKDSVAAYEKREKIDADVQAATRRDLCISLGGLPDDCNELRGLEAAPAGQ